MIKKLGGIVTEADSKKQVKTLKKRILELLPDDFANDPIPFFSEGSTSSTSSQKTPQKPKKPIDVPSIEEQWAMFYADPDNKRPLSASYHSGESPQKKKGRG